MSKIVYPIIERLADEVIVTARSTVEAQQAAGDAMGGDCTIVTVERVREGGIGGFFATELVRVTARPSRFQRVDRELDAAMTSAEELVSSLRDAAPQFADRLMTELRQPRQREIVIPTEAVEVEQPPTPLATRRTACAVPEQTTTAGTVLVASTSASGAISSTVTAGITAGFGATYATGTVYRANGSAQSYTVDPFTTDAFRTEVTAAAAAFETEVEIETETGSLLGAGMGAGDGVDMFADHFASGLYGADAMQAAPIDDRLDHEFRASEADRYSTADAGQTYTRGDLSSRDDLYSAANASLDEGFTGDELRDAIAEASRADSAPAAAPTSAPHRCTPIAAEDLDRFPMIAPRRNLPPSDPRWSHQALRAIGLPDRIVDIAMLQHPVEGPQWIMALMGAFRTLCAPAPAGPTVLVGPSCANLARQLRLVSVGADELSDSFSSVAIPNVSTNIARSALNDRYVHLMVGGSWQHLASIRPDVVSSATECDLLEAVRLCCAWEATLGWTLVGDKYERIDEFTLVACVRSVLYGNDRVSATAGHS